MKNLEWIKTGLIAHRGLHSLDKAVPENSLLAFSKAIEKGYGIEMDINVLKDGTVVVFHDKDLKRMCNDQRQLKDVTSDDIKDLKLLDTAEKIPSLKETLSMVKGQVPLLIELKHHGDSLLLCESFIKLIQDYQGLWAMHSYHPKILIWFKKNNPEVIRGQISEYFKANTDLSKLSKCLLKTLSLNFLTKPDFINYGLKDMPNRYLNRAMRKGLVVIGYAAQTQQELDFVKAHYHNAVFEYFEPKRQTK